MALEMLIVALENVLPVSEIAMHLRDSFRQDFFGFIESSELLLFFSKELISKDYYSFLSGLSCYGKITSASVRKVDFDSLVKDMRFFSYFATAKIMGKS